MNGSSVYIGICIYERETETLNSKRSHTFILIHIYIHTHEQGKLGLSFLAPDFPYTYIPIYTQGGVSDGTQ
jgi:hypothetical protein